MSAEITHNKHLSERIKFGLIPVLVLILGAVLFWPSEEDPADPVPALVEPAIANRARPVTNPLTAAMPKILWPDYSLEEIAAFSPFDPLATVVDGGPTLDDTGLVSGTVEGSEQPAPGKPAIRTLKTGPLQAVYHDGRSTVALVDSRVVRPGDFLEEGVRIVEITSEGVIVEVQ